jgi:3-(3-hydroxy-phenyl)propionate hydroxylase
VGRLFIQPDVENSEGKREKFDEIQGPWFSIIGFRTNPLKHVSEENKVFWSELDTRYIQVNRSKSGLNYDQRLQAEGVVSVEDVDHALEDWFTDVREKIVILRPDRFIAAITSPARLNEALDSLRKQLS